MDSQPASEEELGTSKIGPHAVTGFPDTKTKCCRVASATHGRRTEGGH